MLIMMMMMLSMMMMALMTTMKLSNYSGNVNIYDDYWLILFTTNRYQEDIIGAVSSCSK